MDHRLTIKHLGPIKECKLELTQFTILTGPQSNGKSTVAKAVYFFRTIKQDILEIIMQGGPQVVMGMPRAKWEKCLTQRLKDKFMQLFGTSWVMPQDMYMEYEYAPNVSIRVFLSPDWESGELNYINIEYSDTIKDYFVELENHGAFSNIDLSQKNHEKKALETLFNDPYETIFIPAGRNLITLLSTQLNYIFTSLEGSQLRSIDYVTKRYTELILKLKPIFSNGMDGVWQEARETRRIPREMKSAINLLVKKANEVLKCTYKYVDGEERLYLDRNRYIKINLASSGQQEIVWVFNLLFYFMLEQKKVFLILEEPESHLYPESQRIIGETLSLFAKVGNSELITTHSPYLLGTFNYLLMAGQCPEDKQESIKSRIHKLTWLSPETTSARFIQGGKMLSAMTKDEECSLIQNERIDGASININKLTDLVLEQIGSEEDESEY